MASPAEVTGSEVMEVGRGRHVIESCLGHVVFGDFEKKFQFFNLARHSVILLFKLVINKYALKIN